MASLRNTGTGRLIDDLGEAAWPSLGHPAAVAQILLPRGSPLASVWGRVRPAAVTRSLRPTARPPTPPGPLSLPPSAGEDEAGWEQVAALPFVDQAASPPLTRALWLPRLSAARNRRMDYVLLRRRGGPAKA